MSEKQLKLFQNSPELKEAAISTFFKRTIPKIEAEVKRIITPFINSQIFHDSHYLMPQGDNSKLSLPLFPKKDNNSLNTWLNIYFTNNGNNSVEISFEISEGRDAPNKYLLFSPDEPETYVINQEDFKGEEIKDIESITKIEPKVINKIIKTRFGLQYAKKIKNNEDVADLLIKLGELKGLGILSEENINEITKSAYQKLLFYYQEENM